MNVPSTSPVAPPVRTATGAPRVAPRDADGDHDGTTGSAAVAAKPPVAITKGNKMDGYV